MKVDSETFFKRWPNGPQGCFYWDDDLTWSASGSLAPGESFTFVPSTPTCDNAEQPVIMAWASWDASQLEITSVMPDNDGISDDLTQVGMPVVGKRVGNRANLCMFTGGTRAYSYAITIKNVGAETASAVKLSGEQKNGWPIFYYDRCSRADADGDGWNDSLEHVMGQLTYYGYPDDGTYPYDTFMASNWLRATGTAAADDELDVSPADFNDDGRVDDLDVQRVAAHLGEGTGVPLDSIGPNPGTANYLYDQAQPWRRYDVDGDGYVTAADRALVESLVGKNLSIAGDATPPTVRIRNPAEGSTVQRGSYTMVSAYAADSGWLDSVDFYVDGRLLCRVAEGGPATANNDESHYRCGWQISRKGTGHTIEVRARDAAGHVTSQTIRVTAR